MDSEQRRLHAVGGPEEVRHTFETALFEVKRVIVGQEQMLERVFVALLADGHILLEGVPGLAKTMTIKAVSDVLGGQLQAHPVHPRPGPLGPGRHAHLPGGPARVRDRARPGVLQLPARRRDQPRARKGAVGAARGDAGAPGHDRPRDVQGAAPVPGAGDPEPDRVGGHLPAAGGADRPLHVQDGGRLPLRPRGGRGRGPLARGHARHRAGAVARAAGRGSGRDARGVRGPRRERVRGRARRGDARGRSSTGWTRSRSTSSSAPARAARST